MDFVYIQPGAFMMGSPTSDPQRNSDERQHRVTLTQGYYLQTTEVTQGQWKRVVGSSPSYFKNCGADCPVENVSWHDVQLFIQRLNQKEGTETYRLPTEAEWEYAARAGTQTPFFFGDCLSTDQANYNGHYPIHGCGKGRYREHLVPVGSFSPNDWGLHDMHGNVWEWCQDWYGDYPTGSVTDPKGPESGQARVYRGGSWGSGATDCRSAFRLRLTPVDRGIFLGLRLARTR
jgi:formylglycine-generating enzyme required for sulfatase activity